MFFCFCKAPTNGYIKVTIVSTAKNTNFRNIIIDIATPTEDYSGSIAETMSLANGGDCMGGDDGLDSDQGSSFCVLGCKAIAALAATGAVAEFTATVLSCAGDPVNTSGCVANAKAVLSLKLQNIETVKIKCIDDCD